MKKAIYTLLLVTSIGFPVLAQKTAVPAEGKRNEKFKNAAPEEKARASANHAEKKLGLTPEQKQKWETASLERIKSNEAIQEKMKGPTSPEERKNMRAEAKQHKDKFDNSVSSFLTAEQKTKWEQMKEEKKREGREGLKQGKERIEDLEE